MTSFKSGNILNLRTLGNILEQMTIMKRTILISATTMLLVFSATAQDKIIMRSGDTLKVQITKTTPDFVEFTYPKETLVNTEYKNTIVKIIYSSGREEVCSEKTQLQKINGVDDWEKVVITYTESDVKGLSKVGQITKTSGLGGGGIMSTTLGYKDALKKIKKEAAKQGACIVWITDNTNEYTTHVRLTGIAYK
jgi:hypothetical protein